ncbi:MAG: hypothetical protein M3313_17370 [Actinomycetota bacterium]|nr:hypothetical protein [Actinomycetota bacterium]
MPTALVGQPALRRWSLRAELIAVGVSAAVVLAAFVSEPLWGDVHARFPPLSAHLQPAFGPGLLLAAATAALTIAYGPRLALVLSWRRLLWLTWLAGLLWGLGLALIRGWSGGIVKPLTNPAEYLADIDRSANMGPLLSNFAEYIVYAAPEHWTTQVAGHPPLSFLFYLALDRIGLGGAAWGGAITAGIGSTGIVAVLVTLRALRDARTARRAAPFLALTPAVIWLVVSADGIFLAVSAWSIALGALSLATARRKPETRPGWAKAAHRGRPRGVALALAAGIGLGASLFLSYGLVLLLPVALVVLVLRRAWWPVVPAAIGAAAVAVAFAAAGFWWFEGQAAVVIRYYEGIGALRPYSYWIWANAAVLAIALGPAVIAGIGAVINRLRQGGHRVPPAYWLAAAALSGMLAASLSGLSKSEVERIWLPFMVWLIPLAAATSPDRQRGWLLAQVIGAGTVAVLLDTSW